MATSEDAEHPLSIALRDLAYGLAKSGRWEGFVFEEREQLFLHGRSSRADPWWIWDIGVKRRNRHGSEEDARRIKLLVEAALEHMGFRICRQDCFVPDTTIISPPITDLSAHARMEILGRIAPLLTMCEETVREMP